MLIPFSWLSEYVDITLPPDELAHRLTMGGIEVGDVITRAVGRAASSATCAPPGRIPMRIR